jgi:radical SAM superfamily enzyme YgiQ (UPF0313 family)
MVEERLIELCKQAQELAKEGVKVERTWVDSIIAGGIESPELIEGILDRLLDYVLWGQGEREFQRLNDHYASFNPENADFYLRLYHEIMES